MCVYSCVYAHVCPFIVGLKLTVQPLRAAVSTPGQDCAAGSPTGVKMAFFLIHCRQQHLMPSGDSRSM